MKQECKEMVEGYSGPPGDPWLAEPVPHDPPRPRAPGARPKSSAASGSIDMTLEQARLLVQQRGGSLEPSQIPHGIPPTLVRAPPAALKSRPPISQRDLQEQKMKALLDQMHAMAEQLSSAQENL
eukprot:9493555-Pyramimonas_sp.AAC.1